MSLQIYQFNYGIQEVYAAAFVINHISCGSAKLKAFKKMSFS